MKKLLLLISISPFAFGQVLINTENAEDISDIAGNAVIEIRGDGTQTLRLPHIAQESSISAGNYETAMLLYREDQGCFAFHDGTSLSSCIEDIKTERLITNTYDNPPTAVNNSSTYQSFPLLTGSNTFEIDVVNAAVVFKVRSSHNIVHNNGPGNFMCGSQELALYVDNVLSETVVHQYPVDSSGRIFPVELYFIKELSQGNHTVDLRYRNPNPSCAPTSANRYLAPTLAITIKEI
ncbi:hypothetical protein UJ101_02082 [Flavobacteriaceae bacterium UJ101]|nr:hypothetical protein UJ101_02082 [Flavobacteriaceae bacterium UJ101]